ncbi:helix-turn-helix domain-containing protein [Xylella fastidiosa subsp. multiplex]|uniref:helix-turn-helix domain-containing protein n=1 Tax=Xylella fastidiosa TaxID=2371 RepID=UPI0009C07ECE|nr:helix-turn-helix transcriptional regulator [Xylella fastidiosa]MDD0927904.1 helix-turn-helix domain-containing protein [Xylella fastidiosa subsp. multiplex]TNW24047.1 XRE family transcriptional regulator [Xylella fastidiosa subsp. pauca]
MKGATHKQGKTGAPKKKRIIPEERLIFASNFSKARKAAKLSQRVISDKTGFAQPWISLVENGKSTISVDNMAALAKCVGVPLWQLLLPPS